MDYEHILVLGVWFVGIQLSFTLLNTDPSSLHTEWNIEQAVNGKYITVVYALLM